MKKIITVVVLALLGITAQAQTITVSNPEISIDGDYVDHGYGLLVFIDKGPKCTATGLCIELPEGLSFGADLSWNSLVAPDHKLERHNNKFFLYSLKNTAFIDDGYLMAIPLKVDDYSLCGEFEGRVTDIQIARKDHRLVKPADVPFTVTINNTMSINNLKADDEPRVIYSPYGIRVKEEQPGINIIRNSKSVEKKLLR